MLGCLLLSLPTQAERLKDLASIQGVRSNQLIGYGLVVGLNGTGDQTTQTPFTVQTFNNMLAQFGIKVPPGGNVQLKNVAAVSVHADLPAFAKPGQTIDITISSIGNAKSLRGGSLLMTPLKGIDGNVYAIAQGNLTITVQETPQVSQPTPFSRGGTTTVTPQSQVGVEEEKGKKLITLRDGASLASLVAGLNALGVSPRDMISILQAIKAAGALQADIEVM